MANYISSEGAWKEDLVRRDFCLHEAEEILNTTIEGNLDNDVRRWLFHPKGMYTVKTGYQRGALSHEQRTNGDKPSGSKPDGEW